MLELEQSQRSRQAASDYYSPSRVGTPVWIVVRCIPISNGTAVAYWFEIFSHA